MLSAEPGVQLPWRLLLADAWTRQAAQRARRLRGGDRQATASWALERLAQAEATVREALACKAHAETRAALVGAAAAALEASAASWQAFGPVAGPRQLHLVRSLERHLAEHERTVLGAATGHRLRRRMVAAPATTAHRAVHRLARDTAERAATLTTLEDCALRFATVAIRAVENLEATGRADGRGGRCPRPDPATLQGHFLELHEHAETLNDPGQHSDLAGWLAECLVILTPPPLAALPASTIEGGGATHDPVDERRRWLRLGARELLIARTLGPCSSEVVCADAADLLADTGLAARPHDFDAVRAWEHQAAAHSALVPVCGRALRGSHDAAHRARELFAERLAHTVAVLWLINHPTCRPRGETDMRPARPS